MDIRSLQVVQILVSAAQLRGERTVTIDTNDMIGVLEIVQEVINKAEEMQDELESVARTLKAVADAFED